MKVNVWMDSDGECRMYDETYEGMESQKLLGSLDLKIEKTVTKEARVSYNLSSNGYCNAEGWVPSNATNIRLVFDVPEGT
jgi:hypothetical protein